MRTTDRTTIKTHPDTYAARLGAFTTYDGVTVPQSHELWDDTTTPRTDRPVRFYPKGRPAPYPGPTDVCVELAYGTAFRVSDAIRVF